MLPKQRLFAILFLCVSVSLAALFASLFNLSVFLPIALACGIIAVILIAQKPLAFLSILFVIRMITDYTSQNMNIDFLDISLSLSKIIGVGIAILSVPFLFKYRKQLLSFQLIVPFALLFTWGCASLLFSVDPTKTLQDLIRVFDIFSIGFIAFISIKNHKDFQTFLLVVLLASIIPIITGFVQFILGIGLQDDSVSIARIYGTFSHPNVYSLYLFSVIVCVVLFLLSTQDNAHKHIRLFFGSFILIASFIVLILAFARVAWVVVFFFFIVLSLWKKPKLIFPILVIPVIIFASSETFQDRVVQTFNQSSDSSVSWRTQIWQDTTQMTLRENRTWYGYGLEAFPKAAEDLRGIQFGSNDAHNDYVKFFVEGGIIGLVVFLTYVSLIFKGMISRYKTTQHSRTKLIFGMLIIFFTSIMLAALTDNIFKNTPLLWVFFSLLGGALALYEQESEQASKTL
jgi:O-antigen ligase